MKFNRIIWTLVSILMMLVAFQITGCGSKGGGGDGDAVVVEVGDITLTLDKTRLDGNGTDTITITATVTDTDGNPMQNGTVVTFASQTMDIDDTQDDIQLTFETTIEDGVAAATLTASDVGVAFEDIETVTVTINDTEESIDITVVGPPVLSGLSISSGSEDDEVVAGGENVLIQAVINDINGNPVADGTEVRFVTEYGSFEDYARDLVKEKTVSTVDGVASVFLESPTNVGQTKVSVWVNGISKNIFIDIIAGQLDHVIITANPQSLPFGSSSLITATAFDEWNNPVIGKTLKFQATDGPDTVGSFSPQNTEETDENGQAQVTFVPPVFPNDTGVTISVFSTGDDAPIGDANVIVEGPDVALITLDADTVTLYGTDEATITATVTDSLGNAVPNADITFTSEIMDINPSTGEVDLRYTTQTDASGIAHAKIKKSSVTINFSPSEVVTASVEDVSQPITFTIIGPPRSVVLTAPSSVIVGAQTLIEATVSDYNGNAVKDGTDVVFSSTAGMFEDYARAMENPKTVATINGQATVYLVSSENVGQANVTVTVDGGLTTETDIDFVVGPIHHVDLTANPTSIPFGSTESVITARAFDEYGNPISGESLKFEAGQGASFSPSNVAVTDANGQAQVTYVAPVSAEDTTDTIEVYSSAAEVDPLGTYEISIEGPKVATITLSVNPATLPADGVSEADVKAELTLIGGGDVPDGIDVTFEIKSGGGSISATAKTAGGTGIATATLTAGATAEIITIRASAGSVYQEITVEFTPGNVTLTIVPNTILATGQGTANLTALLTDVDGVPVGDGEVVTFSLDDQSFGAIASTADLDPDTNPLTGTTMNGTGEVDATFTGAQKGGTVTVIAKWDSGGTFVSGTGTITILSPPVQIELPEGSPDPASINIRGTSGDTTSQITFNISDISGDPVADGYPFVLEISSPVGGGEEITPTFAETEDGQVNVILRSGTKSGPVGIRIRYLYDSDINQELSIPITNGPPVGEAFGIRAEYLNVSGLNYGGLEDGITVNVGDIYGNAVPEGTAVSFKTYDTGGIFANPEEYVGTVNGKASNILETPGSNTTPLEGFAFVTVESNNSGRSTHVTAIDSYFDGNSSLVYTGTDGGGVYKSEDGGWTWSNISRSSTSTGQNVLDPYVNDISIDPDDPDTIFAATGYGGRGNIYRSSNGGFSWNSNENPEEWYGVFSDYNAVKTILCDTDSDYVWAGTAGKGVVYVENGLDKVVNFHWGGWIDPISPSQWQNAAMTILESTTNTGDGTVTNFALSPTSVTEDWTLTYEQTGVEATTPVFTDNSGSHADGDMTVSSVGEDAGTALWSAEYKGGYGAMVLPAGDVINEEDGILYVEEVNGNRRETWTVTCTVAGVGVDPVFTVSGSYSGPQATVFDYHNQPYVTDGGQVAFTIVEDGLFVPGDQFIFRTTADGNSRIENANGELFVSTLSGSTKTEEWQVTCVDAANDQFTVISKSGSGTVSHGTYTVTPGLSFTSQGNEVTFFITETGSFVNGDTFTFHTMKDSWWVYEDAALQNNTAKTDVAYTSDDDEVSFTISSGSIFYGNGDTWEFNSVASANWKVEGSTSGVQANRAENGVPYVSDGYEVYFTIEEGTTAFDLADEFTFTLNDSGLGENTTVRDIVKKPDLSGTGANSGADATLYAATSAGVYRSTNGGLQWIKDGDFSGDNIMTLAHHPTLNAIYAGTEAAGVWYSLDGGTTWTPQNTGFGKGLSASMPLADVNNWGTGIMTVSDVGRDALSETWTVTCTTVAVDGGTFEVTGSVSGAQTDYDIQNGDYTTDGGEVTFNIADGYLDFEIGDTFTFTTTRDREQHIKDLVVANGRLYAVTYFEGATEPHAVSNVYSIVINGADGALDAGNWIEGNTGLPQFEPPDDTTLFAQHALGFDDNRLFVGGQGINFYQATTGVDTGAPAWTESKQGMTNRIMTRMPVLFSGDCSMSITPEYSSGNYVTFTVYIQDANGNPPIAGSEFVVVQKIGDEEEIIFQYVYADGYIAPGTWRDITNPATNDPHIIGPMYDIGDFIFTFTPTCDTATVPGCSGSTQEVTY